MNSSSSSSNRRGLFLAEGQSQSREEKARGTGKCAAKTQGLKWAGYHPPSRSWYGDGVHPDGKRHRKYGFATEMEASAWAMQTRGPMDELSYAAATLPAAVTRDVANAMNLRSKAGLNPYDEGLFAQLVKDEIARNPTGHKKTFSEAIREWLSRKKWKKQRSKRDAKDLLAQFYDKLGDVLLTAISRKDIEEILNVHSGYRQRNMLGKIKEVFTYCQEARLLGTKPEDTPCFGIKPPSIDMSLPTPILVGDARKLVALAIQTEEILGCTAWVSFCLFGAFRDSEASKVAYDAVNGINGSRGFAYLSRDVAKMRERTFHFDPAQCPNLDLRPYIPGNLHKIVSELPAMTSGPLAPRRRKIDLFKAYARHCGIEWGDNGLRAAFATYHFALFRKAEISSEIMGHLAADGGVKVFSRHYYRFAVHEDGKAYFEIGMTGLKAAGEAFTPPISLAEYQALPPKNSCKQHRKKPKKRPEWDRIWSKPC